jgi:hypothetical protein
MTFDVIIPWWWCTLGWDLCFVVIMVGFLLGRTSFIYMVQHFIRVHPSLAHMFMVI